MMHAHKKANKQKTPANKVQRIPESKTCFFEK